MFQFLKKKLTAKKWMVISLLIGNILLIAVAVSNPLYKQSAMDRMLADEFTAYMTQNGTNPGIFEANLTRNKDSINEFDDARVLLTENNDILGTKLYKQIEYLRSASSQAFYEVKRDQTFEVTIQFSNYTDISNRAKMVAGSMYTGINADGEVEAIISETGMVNMNLVIGDLLTTKTLTDANGDPIKIRITGVFTCDDLTDPYWVLGPADFKSDLFIAPEVFEKMFFEESRDSIILGKWFQVFDIEEMRSTEVNGLLRKTEKLTEQIKDVYGRVPEPEYKIVIDSYSEKVNSVVSSLLVLQAPMLVLLCAFLLMISGQMLSMEQTEISLLKSRGASGRQIFMIYLMQAGMLTFISLIIAIPLGIIMCQMLGSANAFLSFGSRKNLRITLSLEVWLYAILAALISIMVQVIPVISQSRVSIVAAKQKKHASNKRWWQKVYLDVVMLLVSLYGFYSFNSRKEQLVLEVLEGKSLDPLLYFSSALFILGAGLVLLRFWPYLIKLIFSFGKNLWKPDKYASFLQIIRTGHKQLFMMEFLILTVALGIFNATVARTILYNAEEDTAYEIGADLVVSQYWKSNILQYLHGSESELIYNEADSTAFANIDGVKAVTHVLQGKTVTNSHKLNTKAVYYLGVVTNEFGQMVTDNGGNSFPLQDYLNVLSTNPNAVIVSENYKNVNGYKLGDTITFKYTDEQANTWSKEFKGVIYGFFREFPTYVESENLILEDGTAVRQDNYMIVGNLSGMQSQLGMVPYKLWFDLEDGGEKAVFDYITDNNIRLSGYESLDEEVERIHEDPLFQGTNGILTLSFIVILILCSVGFLIYWILSIRERELLFGVFRAMGMSKNSILSMLINEQIFSSVLCLVVGTVIGFIASAMFVPMLQMTYTAGNQVLVTPLVTWPSDMIKLFAVIVLVFIACMYVLAKLIFSMKITNALKLGED